MKKTQDKKRYHVSDLETLRAIADPLRVQILELMEGQSLTVKQVADKGLRLIFKSIAGLLGLHGYYMPNMDEVAEEARELYNNHLRGGEGHMEVGKLVMNVKHKKSTMTLSVKPFGCMPSSGVSDGVQSYVTEKWPSAIFLPQHGKVGDGDP